MPPIVVNRSDSGFMLVPIWQDRSTGPLIVVPPTAVSA